MTHWVIWLGARVQGFTEGEARARRIASVLGPSARIAEREGPVPLEADKAARRLEGEGKVIPLHARRAARKGKRACGPEVA